MLRQALRGKASNFRKFPLHPYGSLSPVIMRSTSPLLAAHLRTFSSIDTDYGDARRPRVNFREQGNREKSLDYREGDDGRRRPRFQNRRGEQPKSAYESQHLSSTNRGLRRGNGSGSRVGDGTATQSAAGNDFQFDKFDDYDRDGNLKKHSSPPDTHPSPDKQLGHDFLEKLKLGFDKGDKHSRDYANLPMHQEQEMRSVADETAAPSQDADEIFKKMKETGLIPNAVAMLDGLCKDGLVQEAMKLFGLMREKGTIPEIVIYTAVVEGFCKAQKLDDAKRIFRKMQNNGISPNAFSYTVLIQGLYEGKQLEDAIEFCTEMLEAGHCPNLATFAAIVDEFCREKGMEEAQRAIATLRQKGFSFDERALREYLDKKGPFLPQVWEAIFGKKSSQRSF